MLCLLISQYTTTTHAFFVPLHVVVLHRTTALTNPGRRSPTAPLFWGVGGRASSLVFVPACSQPLAKRNMRSFMSFHIFGKGGGLSLSSPPTHPIGAPKGSSFGRFYTVPKSPSIPPEQSRLKKVEGKICKCPPPPLALGPWRGEGEARPFSSL